ncbi:hypothetical protein CsatA_003046 [Cannabis sativa]
MKSYVLKAWELVYEGEEVYSWNLVHYHNKIMISCTSLSHKITLLAFHPDGDVFFFSRSNNDNNVEEDVEFFQYLMVSKNHNQIETLLHLPRRVLGRRTNVASLLHPWCPTRIPNGNTTS